MSKRYPLRSLLSFIVDNRGRTCPVAAQGLPLIATNCVKNSTLHPVIDKVRHVDDDTYKNWFRSHPKPGDLVFVLKGSPGQVCLTPDPVNFCIAQDMVALRANKDMIDPSYLFAALRSPQLQNAISNLHVGSMIAHFKKGDFDRLHVPVPDMATQRAIGQFYLSISEKIEQNANIAATLEEMARALYRSWFVDFDPVRARAEGRAPAHMDAATADLFPNNFGEDGLPMGWRVGTTATVCRQAKQTVIPLDKPEQDFWHFSLPAFDAGKVPVLEPGSQIMSNKLFVPNDAILFSRLNPSIPRIWWARADHAVGIPAASTEFFVAVARDDSETPWLYCLLSSIEFQGRALARVTGTSNSHQRVSATAFSEVGIIVPSTRTIAVFSEITRNWFERIHAIGQENRTLATLRDTLLPRLMSGELRVGAARDMIEQIA